MKRFFIPLSLLLAGACTHTIDYDFDKVDSQLLVVGWLEQTAASHTVYLSLSEGGLVKPVGDARVICTVNGEEVADVRLSASDVPEPSFSERYSGSADGQQLPVTFKASLQPGDKVRLAFEANQGAYKARSAELTVPEPVTLSKVDTARVTVRHLDWSDRYLQVRADVPDRPGEDNWYSISLWEVSEGTYSFRDGGPDLTVSFSSVRYMMDVDDPVLLDGNVAETEDLNVLDLSGNGAFACFSDRLFRDASAHLKMNAFSSWNNEGPDFMNLGYALYRQYGEEEMASRGVTRCRAGHRLEVRLSHCSQAAYFYLRALRTISSSGYRPEIMEPVTVPSNLSGGVGFVDVVSTAVAIIDLPAEEEVYDGDESAPDD